MVKGKALRDTIKELVIKDADVLSELIYEAAVDYKVKDIKKSWRALLKNWIFISAVHDVLAVVPRKR